MSGLVNSLVNTVLGAPPWMVYLIVALVVFAEDALFVGFVLPGETLAIIGGVTASLGHTSLGWVLVVVILAAVIGDSVGYEIGKLFGPKVMAHKIFDRRRARLERRFRRSSPALVTCSAVACPSGLRSTPRKRVWGRLHRGFKSHRHRQEGLTEPVGHQ